MAEEFIEDQNLDGDETSSESDVGDSQNEDTGEDTSEHKNKSNWSKLSEAKKVAERKLQVAIAEKEAIASQKEALEYELEKIQEWANSLYGDDQEKPFNKKNAQIAEDKTALLEEKIFLIDNKEAKEYIDLVRAAKEKYNMDLDEAWIYVKAKLPQESKSKTDFNITTKSPTIKKDLKDISPEDALKLSKEEQAKWRKVHKWE